MDQKVLGILNGDWGSDLAIKSWLNSANFVIAADGAANRCLKLNKSPDLTVGDFDSYVGDQSLFQETEVNEDQNSTDCDKLLEVAKQRGFEQLAIIGVEGSLPDHFLASLLSIASSSLNVTIGFQRGVGMILKPKSSVSFKSEGRVSLLPLTACNGVNLQGVQWPLFGEDLSVVGKVSISNQGMGMVRASVEVGFAFLFAETPNIPSWTFFQYE